MSDPMVPRSLMPQIDEKDMAKAIVFFSKAGFGVVAAGDMAPQLLTLHQPVNRHKAEHMTDIVLSKPVLITKFNEVIDGNHRVAKHSAVGTAVPYIQIDCTFVEALDVLNVFPFAYELSETTPERN